MCGICILRSLYNSRGSVYVPALPGNPQAGERYCLCLRYPARRREIPPQYSTGKPFHSCNSSTPCDGLPQGDMSPSRIAITSFLKSSSFTRVSFHFTILRTCRMPVRAQRMMVDVSSYYVCIYGFHHFSLPANTCVDRGSDWESDYVWC